MKEYPGIPLLRPWPALCWHGFRDGLHPVLVTAVEQAAADYFQRFRTRLHATSGRRTLRHQARLMADMTADQLTGLYARRGIPDYIARILVLHEAGAPVTQRQVYAILAGRREGYISAHLYGGAVDLDAENVRAEPLRTLLEARGLSVLDEQSAGIPCLHIAAPQVPRAIMRT